MKKCPNCGFENADNAKFCNECGAGIENIPSVTIPSSTETENTPNVITPPLTETESSSSVTIPPTTETENTTSVNTSTLSKKNPLWFKVFIAMLLFILVVLILWGIFHQSASTTQSNLTGYSEKTAENTVTVQPTVKSTPKPTPAPTVDTKKMADTFKTAREKIVKENYGYVNFTELARNPNSYKGKSLTYEGKVVQTMEDNSLDGLVYYSIRLAVGGNYNSIVYVTYFTGSDEPRILEDDYVQIYGTAEGLYTYESTSGKSVTIPKINAVLIE